MSESWSTTECWRKENIYRLEFGVWPIAFTNRVPEYTILEPDYEDRPKEPQRVDYWGSRQPEHVGGSTFNYLNIIGLTHYNVEWISSSLEMRI